MTELENTQRTQDLAPLKEHQARALEALPLIYVAWADGYISEEEARAVKLLARIGLKLPKEAMRLVDHWLKHQPREALLRLGLGTIRRQTEQERREATPSGGLRTGGGPEHWDELAEFGAAAGMYQGRRWLELAEELDDDELLQELRAMDTAGEEEHRALESGSARASLRRLRTRLRLDTSHSQSLRLERGGLI